MSRTNPRYHRVNALGSPVSPTWGVVRYKIVGTIEGQLTVSDFDYAAQNPGLTGTQQATLLNAISANLFALYKACVSADWVCTYERLDVIHINTMISLNKLSNAGQIGGRAAGHEPTEVAQPIIKYTSLKGQHGRGRISLPAISTTDVTASKITSAGELAAIAAFCAAFVTVANDGTFNWGMVVSTRSTAQPKVAQYFSPVISANGSILLGTIRRRKIGRGK